MNNKQLADAQAQVEFLKEEIQALLHSGRQGELEQANVGMAEMLQHKLLTERKLKQQIAELQQELDAARAEIEKLQDRDNRMRDCPACGESYIHLGDKLSDINAEILKNHYEKQLADALAKAEDYERALEYYKSLPDRGAKAFDALNKWRAK